MLSLRVSVCLLIGAGLVALVAAGDPADRNAPQERRPQKGNPPPATAPADREVVQEFPK